MQPGWCQPVRQEFMENECEALPCVAYPGVWDNRSTVNTKTGYDMMNNEYPCFVLRPLYNFRPGSECVKRRTFSDVQLQDSFSYIF